MGEREDRSGARIAEIMEAQGYTVRKKVILPDDQQMLQDEMIAMCNDDIQLILTTGCNNSYIHVLYSSVI